MKELFGHHSFVRVDNFAIYAAATKINGKAVANILDSNLYAHWNATCIKASGEKFLVMM